VPLAIQRVYVKFLSPEAARDLAAALVEAADAGAAIQAKANAEDEERAQRCRECEAGGGHQWGPPPLTTSHATGAVFGGTWPGAPVRSMSFKVCRRCEHGEWLDDRDGSRPPE
jgi:ribosomal protein L40E